MGQAKWVGKIYNYILKLDNARIYNKFTIKLLIQIYESNLFYYFCSFLAKNSCASEKEVEADKEASEKEEEADKENSWKQKKPTKDSYHLSFTIY